LGQAADAEEVAQDALAYALSRINQYDPGKASFSTWLYQIALNYCRSQLRRKRLLTIPWGNPVSETAKALNTIPGPESTLLQGEYKRILWEAVQALSPRLREVIILHYYLDLPAVEIAAIVDCPAGTIYSRLYNARRRLVKTLTQKGITASEIAEVHHAP